MLVLGFEGSANKLGIGLMKNDEILANKRITYVPPLGKGFKISDASLHHQNGLLPLLKEVLSSTHLKMKDINYLAYTQGPGIGPCLQIVYFFVKILSKRYNIPIVPVNHCIAHIEMGRFITGSINPTVLYVSGGNTQILSFTKSRYKIYGETLDIAIGNLFDRVARLLNIPNEPSPGYNIEQFALLSKTYIELPYIVKGMDVSYSGILTYIKGYLRDKDLTNELISSICYSLQEVAFSMLIEVTERVMACTGSKEVLVVGGVGCNLRLQNMAITMSEQRGGRGYTSDERYCIDNGLMIAHTAVKMINSNYVPKDFSITQRYRTDTVDITWRQ